MLEILPASRYYKNKAVGAVAVHNGRLAIHLATRAAVAQWALGTCSRILEGLTRRTEDPAVLQAAIDDVEYAAKAARRKLYEHHRVLELARTKLAQISLPAAA